MEKQETFTRAEVEALLLQQHEANIQAVREHFQQERRNQTPPLWLSIVVLVAVVGTLYGIAVWG